MLENLYNIFIYPIFMLYEVAFDILLVKFSYNIGLVIITLSFLVNIICLPLYLISEKLQLEQKNIQEKLQDKVNSIKKNFKGDEQYMLLSTYYRQNDYHPIMQLRSASSLIIQALFFVVAYQFFLNLQILNNASCAFISDLSKPDALFVLGQWKLNILPVLMTTISVCSGLFYALSRPHSKDKVQTLILPFVFLFLLYNAPSGLVIYWIFNNIFSLIKNIVIFCINKKFLKIEMPTYKAMFSKFAEFLNKNNFEIDGSFYFVSIFSLFLLVGFFIPSSLISSSVLYFFDFIEMKFYSDYLISNACKAFGLYIFLMSALYYFANSLIRKIITVLSIVFVGWATINVILLAYPQSNISNLLVYNSWSNFVHARVLWIYGILLACWLVFLFYYLLKNQKILKNILVIFLISFSFVSLYYLSSVFYKMNAVAKELKSEKGFEDFTPFYNFSKTQKNVLIIIMDRAISSFLPLVFTEKPELKEAYTGFTFYPNTLSFAGHTILAYPPLVGGYEYTPMNLERNKNKSMKEKHTEALLVLPRLFKENNWSVKITDSPWGEYKDITSAKLFTKYGIDYKNAVGRYSAHYKNHHFAKEGIGSEYDLIKRNLFYFSVMRTFGMRIRQFIYDAGHYHEHGSINVANIGITKEALDNYSSLFYLPKITTYNSDKPVFNLINNKLTHSESSLYYPGYVLNGLASQKSYLEGDMYDVRHYQLNAAALILLANYLNELKANGVYNNTRIIIVADHGAPQVDNPYFSERINNAVMSFNPLLLVKDFNAQGEFKINYEFMTNANVPYLAAMSIINNPINIFTGNKLTKKSLEYSYVVRQDAHAYPDEFRGYSPFKKEARFMYLPNNFFNLQTYPKVLEFKDFISNKHSFDF